MFSLKGRARLMAGGLLGGAMLVAACNALFGVDELSYTTTVSGGAGGVSSSLTTGGGGTTTTAAAGGQGGSASGGGGTGGVGGSKAVQLSFGERSDADVQNVTSDTTIGAAFGDMVQNFGGATRFEVDGQPIHVGLLRFDLSSVASNATVLGAALSLVTGDCSYCALEGGTIELFALLEAWDEGALDGAPGVCNWLDRQADKQWQTAGAGPGSRAPMPLANFMPAEIETAYDVVLPAALVQGWINDSASNFGISFESTATQKGALFASSESNDQAARPLLVLELLFPPQPPD